MPTFRLVFDLIMTAWPLAFVLLLPARPALQGERLLDCRRRTVWLVLASAAAWCVIVLIHARFPDVHSLWVLCFILWFAGAMPILRIKRRDWVESATDTSPTRQASLVSRVHASPVPGSWWAAAWCVWTLLFAITIAIAVTGAGNPLVPALLPAFFNGLGACWLIMGQYGMRWFLLEPEPLDSSGSRALLDAYDRLRRFKTCGWFALAVGAMLVFSCTGWMMTAGVSVVATVVVGAGGGSLLGVLGGVYGTYASVLRGRVAELRRHLDGHAGTMDSSI